MLRVAVVASDVGVAGQGVTDVDGVCSVSVQLAVCLVGDLNRSDRVARLEDQRVALGKEDDPVRLNLSD